jgi:hypothetical protein
VVHKSINQWAKEENKTTTTTNKQIQRLRTHQNAAGDKRPTREIHGVTEFRVQSRNTERERQRERDKEKDIVRERERERERGTLRAHKGAYRTCFRQKTEKGIK